MTTWFTSDLHLGHDAILEYTDRRREHYFPEGQLALADYTVDEVREGVADHDDWVIDTINSYTKETEVLYILGDVSFHSKWQSGALIERIHAHKHLILGNHDHRLGEFYEKSELFESVSTRLEFKLNKKRLILDHFPSVQWNAGQHGSWHLHGHCHGDFDYAKANLHDKRILDVGWDSSYKLFGKHRPFSFEDVAEIFKDRVSIEHHGKAD